MIYTTTISINFYNDLSLSLTLSLSLSLTHTLSLTHSLSLSLIPRRLMIYNTTISIILFVPVLAAFDELPGMTTMVINRDVFNALVVTGLLGFLINIAIFMQVKYTTPLTNAISGTAKA